MPCALLELWSRLLPPSVTRVCCLIAEAHSRDQRCPANYYTLINRTRVAIRSRPPPTLPSAISHFLHSISFFRASCLLVPFSFHPVSSSALITALPPPSPSPFLSVYTRAYALTVRECHGSDRFSRPRTVDAASGERRTGVVR